MVRSTGPFTLRRKRNIKVPVGTGLGGLMGLGFRLIPVQPIPAMSTRQTETTAFEKTRMRTSDIFETSGNHPRWPLA
jgi:hypothetical protein